MVTSAIEKFIIELGFSDSEAVKGLKGYLKKLDQASKRTQQKLKQENSLLSAQNALRRKIIQAEKAGLNVQSYKKSLNAAKKVDTVRRRTLELDKQILDYQKSQAKVDKDLATFREAANQEILRDTKARLEVENTLSKQKQADELRRIKEQQKEFQLVEKRLQQGREASAKRQQELDIATLKKNKSAQDVIYKTESARRKQAIDGLTEQNGELLKMRQYYKQLEKDAGKADKDLAAFREAANKEILNDTKTRLKTEQDKLKALSKIESARRKQAVGSLTEQNGELLKMRQHYKQLEKDAAKVVKKNKEGVDVYTRYMNAVRRSSNFRFLASQDPTQARGIFSQLQSAASNRDIERMRDLGAQIRDTTSAMRRHTRATVGLNVVQTGLNDSTRNLIRSYASVFALLEGTSAINRVGQDFEAMNSAMLTATGSAKAAQDEIQFLDTLTGRLGLSLLDVSDSYNKFLFSSKGKLTMEQTRELFTGISELGTTLGISKERMKLSMRAIQQMMNKTVVSSEELKLQLSESLPGKVKNAPLHSNVY